MDSFSGSEPRTFISFRIDTEKTGQPVQDSNNLIATPVPSSSLNVYSTNPANGDSTNQQSEPMDAESTEPQTPIDPATTSRLLTSDSSGSRESCEAYLVRKLQDMEGQASSQPLGVTVENQRQIEVTPRSNLFSSKPALALDVPKVTFLDDPIASSDGSRSPDCENPTKRSKMTHPSVNADSSFNIYCQRSSSLTPTVQSAELPAQEGHATTSHQPALSCTTSDGEA